MFQFYSDASEYFTAVRDLDLVRELNPELQTLDSWLTQHKSELDRIQPRPERSLPTR